MSLTEIMSAAGLSRYAEVGLVLFLIAFVLVIARITIPGERRSWERAARLPLDDDQSTSPRSDQE